MEVASLILEKWDVQKREKELWSEGDQMLQGNALCVCAMDILNNFLTYHNPETKLKKTLSTFGSISFRFSL